MSKIIFVFGALGGGGTQRQFSDLIRHMDRGKWDLHLCTIGTNEVAAETHLEKYPSETDLIGADESIRWAEISKYYLFRRLKGVLPIHFVQRNHRWDIIGPLWNTWKVIHSVKPDIVFCVTPMAGHYGRLAARFAGVRRIVQGVRGTPSSDRINRFRQTFLLVYERLLMLITLLFVGNSQAVTQSLTENGISHNKLLIIYNGIKIPVKDEVQNPEFVPETGKIHLGIFARLYPMKDHLTLLNAVRLIPREIQIKCHIFGNGPEKNTLVSQSDSMGISDRVVFHGWVPDARYIIPLMDVVVLSSKDGEGFNNSIAEAQMAGVPVVTTAAPGCSEIIQDNYTGYIVPINSPDDMARMLTKLLTDDTLRAKFGENARQYAERTYSLSKMISEYECLFTDILGGKYGV